MAGKRFTRKIEDFKCEKCGAQVKGTGYTDHCPKCLWSKHVDNNPGDRASDCKELMMPIHSEYTRGQFMITYRCMACGMLKRVKAAKEDNEELLHSIIKG